MRDLARYQVILGKDGDHQQNKQFASLFLS